MDEDRDSQARALRRIARYLDVPIERLFGLPANAISSRNARVPNAEVRKLLVAFMNLDDVNARTRVIDAATAEVDAEKERARLKDRKQGKKPAAAKPGGLGS